MIEKLEKSLQITDAERTGAHTILKDWKTFNSHLLRLSMRSLAVCLVVEAKAKKRRNVMKRLHSRLCKMRREKEWEAIRKEVCFDE